MKENSGRARPNRINLMWFTMESVAYGTANTWPWGSPNSFPLSWTKGQPPPTQEPEYPQAFSKEKHPLRRHRLCPLCPRRLLHKPPNPPHLDAVRPWERHGQRPDPRYLDPKHVRHEDLKRHRPLHVAKIGCQQAKGGPG